MRVNSTLLSVDSSIFVVFVFAVDYFRAFISFITQFLIRSLRTWRTILTNEKNNENYLLITALSLIMCIKFSPCSQAREVSDIWIAEMHNKNVSLPLKLTRAGTCCYFDWIFILFFMHSCSTNRDGTWREIRLISSVLSSIVNWKDLQSELRLFDGILMTSTFDLDKSWLICILYCSSIEFSPIPGRNEMADYV